MRGVSLRSTLITGAAVLALWLASWGASYVDLGPWSLVVALGIAAAKAILVVLFFMEIITENRSIRVAAATGVGMVAIMISLMILDVRTRWTPPLEPTAARRAIP